MADTGSLFDFIFKEHDGTHFAELRQGDLLLKTQALSDAIQQGHRHYATNPDYTHFLVLTQSCDLAVRAAGRCRADYLTICAVKPLERFLDKKLAGVFHSSDAPIRLGRKELRRSAQSVVDRLVSNTHDEVFYLDAGCAQSLVEPSCAFLQLSIALRQEHFDALLRAKQAEMSDVFAAKLGWMTGNLYSRVGTPDLYEMHPGEAQAYVDELARKILAAETWLTDKEYKKYATQHKKIKDDKGSVSQSDAEAILRSLPSPIDELAEAIIEVLRKNKIETDEKRLRQIQFRMANDQKLKQIATAKS